MKYFLLNILKARFFYQKGIKTSENYKAAATGYVWLYFNSSNMHILYDFSLLPRLHGRIISKMEGRFWTKWLEPVFKLLIKMLFHYIIDYRCNWGQSITDWTSCSLHWPIISDHVPFLGCTILLKTPVAQVKSRCT